MWKFFLLFIWLCLMGRSMILITSMIWIISMIPLPFIDINSMEENFVPDIKSSFSHQTIIQILTYQCITFSYHSFGHLSIYTTDYSSLFYHYFWHVFLELMAALKRAFGVVVVVVIKRWKESFTSFPSSWGEGQLGCWEGHHLERWWLQREACSTPRHCGWQVADVLG